MPRIKIVTANVRWLLLDRTKPQYNGLRTVCLNRHNEIATKDSITNNFSEVLSDDGTLGLAKIPGADSQWRGNVIDNPGMNQAIITVYAEHDQWKAVNMTHDREENGDKKLEADWNWTNQWQEPQI